MKNLELTQMEKVQAGNNCSNAANLLILAGFTTTVITAGFTFGLGAVIGMSISAAAMANCQSGWAEDLIG